MAGHDRTGRDFRLGDLEMNECRHGLSEDCPGCMQETIDAMLEALRNVQKIVADGAMTGFNYKDGDWAERLYESQQVTSAAIKRGRALVGGTLS